AARPHPSPGHVRRSAAPVGQLLPAALRQAGSGLPALPAHHTLRGHGPARRERADPGRAHLRNGGGEPRQQRRPRRVARCAGLSRVVRRHPRRPQLDVLARRLRPAPARADRGGAMRHRRAVEIDGGVTLAYGHYGRPVLAFPSENGQASDWEERGMVDSLASLIDGGRVKLFCAPSFDSESWTRGDLSLEERARRHGHYEWWVLSRLVPFVQSDCHTHELIVTGCSFGAYHAANFCLKRA